MSTTEYGRRRESLASEWLFACIRRTPTDKGEKKMADRAGFIFQSQTAEIAQQIQQR